MGFSSILMEDKSIGIAAALGSAASWALGAVLFKNLGQQLSASTMALVKSIISAALLGLVVLVTGFEPIGMRSLVFLAISGALGIALGDTCFFAALKVLSAHTLIILLTGGQVLTVFLAMLFLDEIPTLATWMGILLVTAGITIVLQANLSGEQQRSQFKGIILGTLSVLCMSVSLIIAKKGLAGISAMQATFIRMLAGGALMLMISGFTWQAGSGCLPFRDRRLLGQFFASVCLVTFGGFWLSLLAVKHLPVAIANTLNSTEPLFVLPLAAWLLREKITWRALVGSVVAVAGISLLCFS